MAALREKSYISLPKSLVERLGFSAGDKFDISEKDGVLCLVPVVDLMNSIWAKEFVELQSTIDDEKFLEETEEKRIARQLKALDEFKEGLAMSEPLGHEFDEIIEHRVKITRDINL